MVNRISGAPRIAVLLLVLGCGGGGASGGAGGGGGGPGSSFATLSDACTAYCARMGPPCNDPTYSDPIYQIGNPGLTPVQICNKVCNGTEYRSSSADFNTVAACDAAELAFITCQARLACGVHAGYACSALCAKEWDAVDQVCSCNAPRCGTLVADACTLRAGECWPLCTGTSICQHGIDCSSTANGIVCSPGVCSSPGSCVPACTGSTTCVNGSCHDVCSECLDACRGLSGCCTGTGCICDSACN